LHAFGPPAVIRLNIDPNAQPAGTMTRRIEVDWLSPPGTSPAVQDQRILGWNGLQDFLGNLCVQLPMTVNSQTLTEQAAIGVMALLISDLKGEVLQRVLPIGSGGDYLILLRGSRKPAQVEVSGIHSDATGAASRARLAQKSAQVLSKSAVGYASVTTFAHASESVVQSYLHYVRRLRKKGGRKGKKK
jgi:hypothetical protein